MIENNSKNLLYFHRRKTKGLEFGADVLGLVAKRSLLAQEQ
jgi:hypothetical protein